MDKKLHYQMICIDLDGTLLNGEKQLSKKNADALKKASDAGIELCIATGRDYQGASFLRELHIPENLSCLNGGRVFSHGIELVSAVMDKKVVLNTIEIIQRFQTHGIINCKETILFINGVPNGFKKMLESTNNSLVKYKEITYEEIKREIERDTFEIQKICVQESYLKRLEEIRAVLLQEVEAQVAKSDVDYLDIYTKGQSKWSGIEKLLCHLQIPIEKCVCIGDNENDVEMVQNAGFGIAMGNANETVKRIAKKITSTNELDGVAYAIENWILS
jgi:Cof subfamily protein (haloacid dehalogenase superfamily)